jgi:hypothetical protein
MRSIIRSSLFILVTGLISGCGSSMAAKSDAPAAAQADKVADANTAMMQSGGANVLQLTMTPDTKCVSQDGLLKFKSPQFEIEVWLVPAAQTVDEAIGRLDKQIAGEFKDFKPDTTTDLTVAGAPAKRLAGKGHEADDGDDGDADIIVFKVGGHVFVGLTHDERLNSPARQGLLALVQTAQAP